MLRLTIFVLAFTAASMMAALRVAGSAGAPSRPTSSHDAPIAQQPPERALVGTLDQVDAEAANFVVRASSGTQRFVLESGATIRQGSKTIKAADLAAHKGERVKVRYRERDGVRHAEWIVVASPPRKSKTSIK